MLLLMIKPTQHTETSVHLGNTFFYSRTITDSSSAWQFMNFFIRLMSVSRTEGFSHRTNGFVSAHQACDGVQSGHKDLYWVVATSSGCCCCCRVALHQSACDKGYKLDRERDELPCFFECSVNLGVVKSSSK